MQIIPRLIPPIARTKSTKISLSQLQNSHQPPNTYTLGLAADGMPVIASIAQSPPILATSDDTASLQALLGTIAATARFPSRQTAMGAIIVSRTPGYWQGAAAISPKRLGDILQSHLEKSSAPRLPILLDNLGAGWNMDYRSLALLARAPQFHLVVTTSPQYACRIRSIFNKILVGSISDFQTLYDLTAPTTLATPPINGQFAFRHQSRWLFFTPATP